MPDYSPSSAPTPPPTPAPTPPDHAARDKQTAVKMIGVTAVVLLVLAGLYWGGRSLLTAPTGDKSAEVVEVTGQTCDKVYTDLVEAYQAAARDKKPVCGVDISNNHFSKVPSAVAQIPALTTLDVSNNDIVEMPAWIGRLTALRQLNLSNNQLTTIAVEVGALQQLQVLDLTGNPLPQSEIEKVRKLLPQATVKF